MHDQVGLVDADYNFNLQFHAGGAVVGVVPKDAGAPQRRPIVWGISLAAAVGSKEAEAIEDFHVYGAPMELTGENIAAVAIDLPGGLNALLAGATPTNLQLIPTPPEQRRARLIGTAAGTVIAKLSVTIVEGTRGVGGGMRVVALDDTGSLRLELRIPPPLANGGITFALSVGQDRYPEDLLPAARFAAALAGCDALRLEIAGLPPVSMRLPDTSSVLAVGVADVVALLEALERVQDATGVPISVPPHLSLDERRHVAAT